MVADVQRVVVDVQSNGSTSAISVVKGLAAANVELFPCPMWPHDAAAKAKHLPPTRPSARQSENVPSRASVAKRNHNHKVTLNLNRRLSLQTVPLSARGVDPICSSGSGPTHFLDELLITASASNVTLTKVSSEHM